MRKNKQHFSPLGRALEGASALHTVVEELIHQLVECYLMPQHERSAFRFTIDPSQAVQASREFFEKSLQGERTLESCVQNLCGERLGDHNKIYITKAQCPALLQMLTRREIIDEGDEVYRREQVSPDQLLSEIYAPLCPHCSAEEKPSVHHETILSYTWRLPKRLQPYFDRDHYAKQELQAAGMRMDLGAVEKQRTKMLRAQRELLHELDSYQGQVLFTSSRVKGSARLVDKLIRVALNHVIGEKHFADVPSIQDMYGFKKIVQGERLIEPAIERMYKYMQKEYGKSSIITIPHSVDKEGHQSMKMRIYYGRGTQRIPVEIQVQDYRQYVHDQSTHPQYELSQKSTEQTAQGLGFQVDALRKSLERIFRRPIHRVPSR
jgi:hypothetical protein